MTRVVAVAGAHSSCGKTLLASLLLRGPCRGFGAAKCTRAPGRCEVITDEHRIEEPGKDTNVLSNAGAARVVWIRTDRKGLPGAWEEALKVFGDLPGIVVEGNSAVDFVNPALLLFVLDVTGPVKAGARDLLARADAWVVNRRAEDGSSDRRARLESALPDIPGGAPGPVFIADLTKRDDDIEKLLAFVRRRVGAKADRGGGP